MHTEPGTSTEAPKAITTMAKMMSTRMRMTAIKQAMVEEHDARNSEGETHTPSMNDPSPFHLSVFLLANKLPYLRLAFYILPQTLPLRLQHPAYI